MNGETINVNSQNQKGRPKKFVAKQIKMRRVVIQRTGTAFDLSYLVLGYVICGNYHGRCQSYLLGICAQFSRSVVSDSLRPHESQHARPPCPLPTPGVHSDSRPSSQWCHPAISSSAVPFSSCPKSLPASPSIRVFSNESTLRMKWPKYWSFSFRIIPSKEIPGLISFRMDWLDLLAVQGTLKNLLYHHNLKASILQCTAFFMIQLSNPYMTTVKPQLWLYRPLLAKWYLCFLIHCLGLSQLFFQGTHLKNFRHASLTQSGGPVP